MAKSLALVTFTENADGSVTADFDPAPRCERCRHLVRETRECYKLSDMQPLVSPGYRNRVKVTADFGCVLFEAKQNDPPDGGD